MPDQVIETMALAHGAAQGVAFFGQRLLVQIDFERQAHAVADQVGHHLDEMHPLFEQAVVGLVGLYREHTLQRAAELDRRGDEGQVPVVEPEPVEEARIVAQARDGDAAAVLEDHADQAFAALVAHRFIDLAVEPVDGVDAQLARIRIDHADHAATEMAGHLQGAQDLAQRLMEVQRARQRLRDAKQHLVVGAQQGGRTGIAHGTAIPPAPCARQGVTVVRRCAAP